jgi:hypothetical protein
MRYEGVCNTPLHEVEQFLHLKGVTHRIIGVLVLEDDVDLLGFLRNGFDSGYPLLKLFAAVQVVESVS